MTTVNILQIFAAHITLTIIFQRKSGSLNMCLKCLTVFQNRKVLKELKLNLLSKFPRYLNLEFLNWGCFATVAFILNTITTIFACVYCRGLMLERAKLHLLVNSLWLKSKCGCLSGDQPVYCAFMYLL